MNQTNLAGPGNDAKRSNTALFLAIGALCAAIVAAGALIGFAPSTSSGAAADATQPKAAPAAGYIDPQKTIAEPQPAAPAVNYKFAKELASAGVAGCAPVVETMTNGLMQGVTEFATASSWSKDAPNGRIVSALTGQKFGASPAVPNGMTGVFASPHDGGKCDGFSVQVVPSPATCPTLQAAIEKNGKALGVLAGVSLLSDGGGEVMLVPTGTNSCIIVGVRVAYAK